MRIFLSVILGIVATSSLAFAQPGAIGTYADPVVSENSIALQRNHLPPV